MDQSQPRGENGNSDHSLDDFGLLKKKHYYQLDLIWWGAHAGLPEHWVEGQGTVQERIEGVQGENVNEAPSHRGTAFHCLIQDLQLFRDARKSIISTALSGCCCWLILVSMH